MLGPAFLEDASQRQPIQEPLPIHSVTFHGFSYLQGTVVQKREKENSRNKQIVIFMGSHRAGQARRWDLPAWELKGLYTTSPADCASLTTFHLGASVSSSLKWRDNTRLC